MDKCYKTRVKIFVNLYIKIIRKLPFKIWLEDDQKLKFILTQIIV